MAKNKFVWLAEANSGEYDDYVSWVEGIFISPESAMIYIDSQYDNDEKVRKWVDGIEINEDGDTVTTFFSSTISKYCPTYFKIRPIEIKS